MSELKMEQNSKLGVQAKNTSPATIREAVEADIPFIFNSWLKSYRGSAATKTISNAVYYQFQHKLIESLLRRCTVLVLCEAGDTNQLLGYLVFETVEGIPVLHYCYIKHSFRKLSLCNKLLQQIDLSKGAFYTHETPNSMRMCAKKGLIYNPYLATLGSKA